MHNPVISIIAAISDNKAIGKENKLLWHISEDLKRFKQITSGHPVIMGRKTYESMGRLLPDRLNIIITRDKNYSVKDAVVVSSFEDGVRKAKEHDKNEIFIIGGGQIYSQAIGIADRLYLTIVHAEFEGDSYFPDYSEFNIKVFEQEGESGGLRYTFLELEKSKDTI